MGADLKRLRNFYSSDEQVHGMSKKRNKNILVPAMPGYDLRFNPLYSSSDEKVDCVKINCQAGKNCKNLPKLEFGKEDFCIFTQVQSSWDEGYWG